jgi:hypothetical protein
LEDPTNEFFSLSELWVINGYITDKHVELRRGQVDDLRDFAR